MLDGEYFVFVELKTGDRLHLIGNSRARMNKKKKKKKNSLLRMAAGINSIMNFKLRTPPHLILCLIRNLL
jgi:hypothetical protein